MSCEIHWCHQCRCHVFNTDVINVDIMSEKHWYHECICHVKIHWCHKCMSHVWKRLPIKLIIKYSNVINSCYTIQCFRHDIYIADISVFHMTSVFFRHLHWWHQCFRHDIYIDNIIVFHMISNENHFIYRWISKKTHSLHFCSCIKNDDNTTIGPFVFVS
jgi:hypothetical protein